MTQKTDKAAKFFCENCGAEVPKDAKMCRKCGRFFSSVRCPACGKTGSPSQFSKGCPACGYADGKSSSQSGNISRQLSSEKKYNHSFNFDNGNNKKISDDKLPWWIFFVLLGVLAGFLLLLLLKF